MHTIKAISIITILSFFLITFSSCKKCKNEAPQARILNNGSSKASVQIKTSDGNTVNINNVDPGMISPYSSYAPGNIVFTISISTKDYVTTVPMSNCFNYDISIDASNNITTKATDRND